MKNYEKWLNKLYSALLVGLVLFYVTRSISATDKNTESSVKLLEFMEVSKELDKKQTSSIEFNKTSIDTLNSKSLRHLGLINDNKSKIVTLKERIDRSGI